MVWTTINGLLNRKVRPALKEIINNGMVLKNEALANYTNKYFANIAAAISAAVPGTLVFTCLAPIVSASCFFFPATLEEVIRIIKNLKNKGSKILDIHPTVIKENLFLFGKHFVTLYNLSVETAIFPN